MQDLGIGVFFPDLPLELDCVVGRAIDGGVWATWRISSHELPQHSTGKIRFVHSTGGLVRGLRDRSDG